MHGVNWKKCIKGKFQFGEILLTWLFFSAAAVKILIGGRKVFILLEKCRQIARALTVKYRRIKIIESVWAGLVCARKTEGRKTKQPSRPVKQLRILFYSAVNKYNCGRRAFTPFGKGSKVDATRSCCLSFFLSPALSEWVELERAGCVPAQAQQLSNLLLAKLAPGCSGFTIPQHWLRFCLKTQLRIPLSAHRPPQNHSRLTEFLPLPSPVIDQEVLSVSSTPNQL